MKQIELKNKSFICEEYFARRYYLLEILTDWRFSVEGAPSITQGCTKLQPSGRHKAKVQFL